MIQRIALTLLLIAAASHSFAASPAHLYRTIGQAEIVATGETVEHGETKVQPLPAGTLVVMLGREDTAAATAAAAPRILVRTVKLTPQLEGLVSSDAIEQVSIEKPANTVPAPAADSGEVPPLIMQQSPEIQAAWKVVDAAIKENATLEKQLPEPYFARGELLAMVQDVDAALRDYLRAVQLAAESDRGLVSYSAYFARLKEALEQYDKSPRPPATGLAPLHYASGVHAFRKGDYQQAIVHFSDAIALDEQKPLYWYYRAVTFYQAGMTDRAEHDALIGCHLEWKNGTADRIGTKLAYVQGQARTWLENLRLGNPSDRLVDRRNK